MGYMKHLITWPPRERSSLRCLNPVIIKVPITPELFLAKMKLRQAHKKNLPKFSVCDIFKGFKN